MIRLSLAILCGCMLLFAGACDGDDDDPDEGGERTATAGAGVGQTPSDGVSPTMGPIRETPTPAPTPDIPASIVLTAEPQQLTCDGVQTSTVTARVLDASGRGVEDGTEVRFSVVTLGTADPIDATTEGGIASTRVTALGRMVGVVVNVSSGAADAAIRIDCL
jgi:hypothetical protein